MTVVVNLFAGPGAGKSTTAALVFAGLKREQVNVELTGEYAKDLTWEGRSAALGFQPYVIAKQMWRVQRLIDKVDVIVTDSPILFGLVYPYPEAGQSWPQYVAEIFGSWDNMNYFLDRGDRPYQTAGRNQTEDEARSIDRRIENTLVDHDVSYRTLGCGNDRHPERIIVAEVLDHLGL